MAVRKRVWTTRKGEDKVAWIVDYADGSGVRRQKTFAKKRDADAFEAKASVEIKEGTHVADRASITVSEAGKLWIASAEDAGLERSTIAQYRQHLNLHITPLIGEIKLAAGTVPSMRAFRDRLREHGRSPAMVKKVLVSLGSIFADAQERGLASRNPVREASSRRKGKERRQEQRHKRRVEVGVDMPTRDEARAIIAALQGRWRPVLLTAIFTGLRASELRGLRWSDLDFEERQLRVRQRADRYNDIGSPKSEAGGRSVPISPIVVNTLKEWKLACPKRDTGEVDADGKAIKALDLVFPSGTGKVESLANIINRGLMPAQVRAGVSVDTGKHDKKGRPILKAKYTGMHALRHFYASWCINRTKDGGLELPAKTVQERLGHSSIVMTLDVYGHLFPQGNDDEELAAAERSLIG